MKAKKSAAKRSSGNKKSFHSYDHLTAVKSIISLLIVMVAGSIFFLFRTYQQNIIMNNMFYPFMILTVIAMALLVSLLFLINPSTTKKK